MSITKEAMIKEAMIQAISRFQCQIEGGDYPQFEDMCLVEIAQNADKENKESAELFFYARVGTDPTLGLENWIRRASSPAQASNPATGASFGTIPVIRPAKQLFALTLASIEALGHLNMLKETDGFFQAFVTNLDSGYQAALEEGRKILAALSVAPGSTLQEKLVALNLEEIKGTPGEMRFLTQNACFNYPELQRIIGLQATTADILRVDIPVCLPSLDVQRYWKDRVVAEVLAPDYVGLGYPIGRGIENRHEQRAMYFIQKIYDPTIVLELLGTLMSHATAERNVSCMTVELVTKIVYTQFEPIGPRDKTLIYDAINYITPIMRNIPRWSQTNENSLRPYVQSLEQLYSCIRDDQARLCQFFMELHQLKSEMLQGHGVNLTPKLTGFVDFCETMLNHIYYKNIQPLPTPQLVNIVRNLRATSHPLDDIGNIRIAELSRLLTERITVLPVSSVQRQLEAGAGAPAPTLRLSQSVPPVSQVTVGGVRQTRRVPEQNSARESAEARALQRAINLAKAAEYARIKWH